MAKTKKKPKSPSARKKMPKAGAAPAMPPIGETASLALSQLLPSRHNPRKTFDAEALADLAESIAAQGLLQNLTVRRPAPERTGGRTEPPLFELISGERRLRALELLAKDGRWPEDEPIVPCRIVLADDGAALALALLENLQRQDVPAMEEAEAFAELRRLDPEAWTTTAISARIGKTQRYVQQRLALVEKLDDQVKEALRAGEIDVTSARALTVAPVKDQRAALEKIKAGHYLWSDPESISEQMLMKLPLVSSAFFDAALYTGEIVDAPSGQRFADKAQFQRLQKDAIETKRAALAEKWAWVEVKRSSPHWDHHDKSSDRKKAGAIIYVQPEGVIVKTGLRKREEGIEKISQEERHRRFEEERQRNLAAAEKFRLALQARIVGDPALALNLLLAHFLGAAILDEHGDPTPLTRRFREAIGEHQLQEPDPTGNCRLGERVNIADLLATLGRLGDESWQLLAALVAEHLSIDHWNGIDPVLAHLARELSIEIPMHLLKEEEAGDDEPELDAEEAAE